MKVKAFLQSPNSEVTTSGQLLRVHGLVGSSSMLGCYAYATQSGAAGFDIEFGAGFWNNVPTRWLFGLDYGRTHPKALKFISEKPNTEVRIYDGAWIVGQDGFVPRLDYHMKAAFLLNNPENKFGMVSGSGNFSASGLSKNVECGVALYAADHAQYTRIFRQSHLAAETLWNGATPLAEIIDLYEAAWVEKKAPQGDDGGEPDYAEVKTFWIEAGYVTRNRGEDRPGNQIDMPRGMNRFFGFHAPIDQPLNSIIGEIIFVTPTGQEVAKNLRMGNNHMEKITLPIPEEYGFDMYDGKVLVFRADGAKHHIRALEEADFDAAFGHSIAGAKVMGSGRRYGYVNE
ncbi:hypothetical protein [Phyllobacterium sp. SB3]|uniref:hypothetical protein n=1 Tax=Phyllobacterium sp. SB3 TaxID=3156073 RepID=UPI0032AF8192